MLEDKEYERDNLFIEMQLCIKKLNYMLNTTIERYGFDREEITSREEAMEFAYNKTSMWTELEIAVDYVQEIKQIEKKLEALGWYGKMYINSDSL